MSGDVTASTSGCGKKGGVKRRGDSAAKTDVRTLERKVRKGATYGGDREESLWRGGKGWDDRGKGLPMNVINVDA